MPVNYSKKLTEYENQCTKQLKLLTGWQKTFTEYYKDQTKNILNNVLNYLMEDHKLKFIWTEISFFDLWWTELNPVDRERVKLYELI